MSTRAPSPKTNKEPVKRLLSPNFITAIIDEDLKTRKHESVVTRFPPEPNGYLHIGHAKSICLNFGLAQDYQGRCNLRFDDTNPTTEDLEYVESIKGDISWLGFDWEDRLYFASDYFEQFYLHALELIKSGKAYVDSLSEEEIREYRGTVTEAGRASPYRERSIAENLDLFKRMRAGEFPDGSHVLRAKIDMASPNMKMRDPLLYRIRHAHHYRTADDWPIYPMYDFAHPLSDALEGVTHSLCTLEFENNRDIYDWLMDNTQPAMRPYQYEFARLNLDYTVLSKRKLIELVKNQHVNGWDDPRLPTIAGLRRRGVTPEAIRNFANHIGVAKTNSRVDIALLEHSIREDLNDKAPRVMAVLQPLKVVISNYPGDKTEELDAPYWPHDVPKEGSRSLPFSREIFIEREDFMEEAPKGFFRLSPGGEVRLRYGYVIKCEEVIKDAQGNISELRCSYDPATLGRDPADGRKVKGVIHWVSAKHALAAEVRLYDRLFNVPNPDEGSDYTDYLNPESLLTLTGSLVEPSVKNDPAGSRYQFERQGYFISDALDSTAEKPVFNRIVGLRDSWAKQRQPEKTTIKPKTRAEAKKPESVGKEPDPSEDFSAEQKARLEHYLSALKLSRTDAIILAADPALSKFFEDAVKAYANPQGLANWLINDLLRELKNKSLADLPFAAADLAALVALIDDGIISNRIAKDVFAEMLKSGDKPQDIVTAKGLEQVSDTAALEAIVDKLLAAHPDKVAAFRAGKTGLLGFFVGQVMRETQGKTKPQLVQQLVQEKLA